jgi:hypothetical protein
MAVWSVCGWGMCLLILRMVVCSVEWRLCSQSVEWRFTVQSPSPRYFKGHVEGICIPPQWAVWDDGAYRVVLGVDQSRWGQATSTAHPQETVQSPSPRYFKGHVGHVYLYTPRLNGRCGAVRYPRMKVDTFAGRRERPKSPPDRRLWMWFRPYTKKTRTTSRKRVRTTLAGKRVVTTFYQTHFPDQAGRWCAQSCCR